MARQKKHLEKDLQDIYKEAPIGLCSLDPNLRYIHINDWLALINGLPVEAHLGRTLREVLPDVAAGVEHQLRKVIETGEPLFDGRVEAETPAHPGVVRTFQHSYYPNRSKDGRIVGVSCVVADITVRKLAEEELADSEQRLRQLLEDRERLNQDLHDGILQSVYAVGRTLETSNLMGHKTPRQAAREVDHGIQLVNSIIQEVRDFITGTRAQPLDGVQFKTTLATLVRSLGHRGSLQFQVEVNAAAANRLTDAERTHLLQIAREALSNSVRHSHGSLGIVSLGRWRDCVRLEMKDDGVGFAVNTLGQSAHGLRNMRERARTIGAYFKVLSKPGRGTRITVDIPPHSS